MPILDSLQEAIERLHDIETDLDVHAYVVDDEVRDVLPGARPDLPEQLFVRQEGDELELALYIDPRIVGSLEKDHPHRLLHAGNLESYCIATEGVSHFVFVAWRAQIGRPVSALEMEIQAEVDKFVCAWLLLAEQGRPMPGTLRGLWRQLFSAYELRDELSSEESSRYHTATRVARRYCRHLMQTYGSDHERTRVQNDVRVFYRHGLAEKVRNAA